MLRRITNKLYSLNHPEIIILLVILICGTLIRFLLLPITDWYADPARDLLVSEHIIKYHEVPHIGHVASGTNPIFYYPPLYFYLLALIQVVSTNILFVLSFLIIGNVWSIFIVYLITKRISGPIPALLAAATYSFSAYFIRNHISLTAYRFDLPIFLTGTYLHLLSVQTKNPKYLYAGYFLLVVAASINYAVLILLPIFMIWSVIAFWKNTYPLFKLFYFVYIQFCIIFFGFARYVISHYGWNSFFAPFSPLNNIKNGNFLQSLIENYKIFLDNIFPQNTTNSMILILGLIAITIIFKRQKLISIFYPISFIITTLILASVKNATMNSYYFYSISPFLIILCSSCVTIKKPLVFTYIIALILCVLCWFTFLPSLGLYKSKQVYKMTEDSVSVMASELSQIHSREHYPNYMFFQLHIINKLDREWQMSAYAYFLERKFGRLLQITDHYHNLEWIGNENYLIIVCDIDTESPVSWCKQHVRENYPNAKFIKQISTQLEEPIFLYKNFL